MRQSGADAAERDAEGAALPDRWSAALSSVRFGPWWVNAAAIVVLGILVVLGFAIDAFTGTLVFIVAVSYVLAACAVAAISVPLLARSSVRIARAAHPRLALFRALAICWIAAWIFDIVTFALVSLATYDVLVTEGVVISESNSFDLTPASWLYSAPIVVIYLAISALIARRFIAPRTDAPLTP